MGVDKNIWKWTTIKDPRIENLTEEEREYYRTYWGFDPVADKIDVPPPGSSTQEIVPYNVKYSYENMVSLEQDPELQAGGVTVHARVDVDDDGNSRNQIIFRRGDRLFKVFCVHAVVYSAQSQSVLDLPDSESQHRGTPIESHPVILSPWEHFAALKSYVAGIASFGFITLLRSLHRPGELADVPDEYALSFTLPAGINLALLRIAPEVVRPLFFAFFRNLFGSQPAKWVIDRLEFYIECGVLDVITDKNFLDSLEISSRKKLLDIYLNLFDDPGSYFDFLKDGVISALLTEDFLEQLDVPLQYDILDKILELKGEINPEETKLGKVLDSLFRRALFREDKELLDPKFLKNIDFFLEECEVRHASLFSVADEQISPEYELRLIYTYFSIWKIDSKAYLSDILYHLLVNRLDEASDAIENSRILKELNDLAPQEWAQLYFNLLVEDCGIFEEFTRKDIHWTYEDEDTDEI